MTPLALSFDVVATIGAVALAVAFLVARGVRVLRRRGAGGCCDGAKACGAAGGPTLTDLRRAAERGAKRAASKEPFPGS